MRVGYRVEPFSASRQLVAAVASVGRQSNSIHAIAEVNITTARRLLKSYRDQMGESLSFTAYLVACLSRAVAENPRLNSFRRGRKLFILDDVVIGVLVERDIRGESVPEPLAIAQAQAKTCRQISNEIRSAQRSAERSLGELSGMKWMRLVPAFLLRAVIRIAARNTRIVARHGVVAVTAVGMFSTGISWFVPLSSATTLMTVGGIHTEPTGAEHLCLTLSFDHDIVDGAPAARFLKKLAELIEGGTLLEQELEEAQRSGEAARSAPPSTPSATKD